MAEYALRLANGADTAARSRMADSLGLTQGGSLAARSGIKRDGGGVVTIQSGTMAAQVSPFMAWVDGTVSAPQSGYPYVLDAAKTVAIAPGHASLARIDTVAVVIRDTAFDGSGSTDAVLQVVSGTPGSGVAPTLPGNSLPLRDINVPAGASAGTGGLSSSNLGTDRRQWLAATGGILPVASTTERNALSAQPGQVVWRMDTSVLEVWNGSTWLVFRKDDGNWSQSGSAAVIVSSSATQNVDVTFPVPFTGTPRVVGITDSTAWYVTTVSKTATGATLKVVHRDGTSTNQTMTVDYIAHGPR